MPGVGHGGPAKGRMTLERRQNAEAARYSAMLESHVEPPTEAEQDTIRRIVARSAKDAEEASMFESMLLGDTVAEASAGAGL